MSKTSYNMKQVMVVVAQDALLLAELAFAIYLGHKEPDQITAIFLRTYIPLAAVTVLVARRMIRLLADKTQPAATPDATAATVAAATTGAAGTTGA